MSQNNELPMLPIVGYLTAFDGGNGFWETESEALSYCGEDTIPEALVTLSNARAALAAQAGRTEKLLQIIAAAYLIAGEYDAPDHVLDVFCHPENVTQEQVDALIPFVVPAGQRVPIAWLAEQFSPGYADQCDYCTVAMTYDPTGFDGFRNVRPLYTGPAPVRQPLTMSVNEFATQLKCAGWKDTGDAQWDGLAKLMKELGVTHDQNNRP